jgi:glycosyltransferase involved in cell wall biosynthesis
VLLARDQSRLYQQAQERIATVAPLSSAESAASAFAGVRSLLRSMHDAWRVFKAIRHYKPQLCVVAEGSLLSQAGFTLLLRLFGQRTWVYVPLVESATSMGFGRGPRRDWLMRHVYRHIPHGWITITHEQALQFKQWSGINTPVCLLPNTVAPEIERAERVSHVVQRPLRVLVLGRLDAHQKGLDALLNFLRDTPELRGELHITLVGEGPYQHEIEQQLHAHPELAAVLSVQGWAPTLNVLRQHDVLLLCSRYEGLPLVMLEAMAVGMPVVASDLPGTRAMLAADCLFAVGDFTQARRLLSGFNNAERYASVVRRNLAVFADRASAAAFALGVSNLTEQLLRVNVLATDATNFSEATPKVNFP